ncbi:MAG: DUF4177 domain-containing protein [Chitinophagales bacterium]
MELERILNKHAAKAWELKSITNNTELSTGLLSSENYSSVLVVLEKEKDRSS